MYIDGTCSPQNIHKHYLTIRSLTSSIYIFAESTTDQAREGRYTGNDGGISQPESNTT